MLEWAIPRPSAAYNFASLPRVNSREPLWDDPGLPARLARGEGYLGDAASGRRETLMIDSATAEPEQLVIYPANTRLPIALAAVTGVFFLSLLVKLYLITPVAIAAVAALGWRWVWQLGSRQDEGDQLVGRGVAVPTLAEVSRPPGWWGSMFLLVANATLFGSLLFGYAFLWTIAPGWPPPAFIAPSLLTMLVAAGGAVLAVAGVTFSGRSNQKGGTPVPGLLAAVAGALGLVAAFSMMLWSAPPATGHAYNATILVLGCYGLAHAALASLMLIFVLARHRAGYMSQRRRGELSIVRVWIMYLFAVTGLVVPAVYLPGLVT
ncbi:hypothetical protein [Hoeflea ulvae]|uniref:Uncharacterized protein n=1 Tax=Hoeflea ulvae TaxID=2983764 RepID=A0ABT3YMC9_9HYPH|nr:hypothetical protein [Hoeflea ulvae]MCY0096993.1 hypothetical protein [Hoeflea ulvae]